KMDPDRKEPTRPEVDLDRLWQWLGQKGLQDEGVYGPAVELVRLMAEHFVRLLAARGETVNDRVREAYPHKSALREYHLRLASAEEKLDQAVVARMGGPADLAQRMASKQEQAAEQRSKEAQALYGA
ncbi:MAG: NF038143 family protein, partial [Chlorobiales bacterium]|nr:NF038143 family protein [Chlorobiales bacterium]